ncbi:MAG TPA: glycosyltransferase family 87 protein, partial [Ktedonobacterales bacterium]|nr:glycosyltransferase family 87 protein [Ktedonobacterales bacterium]
MAGILYYITTIIWSRAYLTLGDVIEYHQYALAFWTQPPLFHQFPQEYPPLALIPFAFTLSPFSGILYYKAFAFWMGTILCLSYLWLARSVSHRKALIYALYLLVGAMATLLMRYDLLPALTTLGALMLTERKRYAWAYVLLAVGALLKLYPAFLVPVVMAAQWQEIPSERAAPSDTPKQEAQASLWQRAQPLLKGVWLFVLIVALGFGVPLAFNAAQATSVFSYNLTRPIQVESAPASLLWLGSFIGFPVR